MRYGARLLLVAVLLASAAAAEKEVMLCHVPPEDGVGRVTIVVAAPAVEAHLAHGDQRNACSPDDPARCGDGIVQPPEECDDANDNPFDGCDRCILVDTTPD